MDIVLETRDITKSFKTGQIRVDVLKGITLQIQRGEFTGIIGPSGSGKSTLLGIIGGLDLPTSGQVILDGLDITRVSENKLTEIRNQKIGFVFQSFNLIPSLSAQQNVALPIRFSKKRNFNASKRAKELLQLLGMSDRLHHRPSQLSGGQQQRVAIARALANDPAVLLADEPTGNLDTESSQMVMAAFRHVREQLGTTVIVITHDMEIASQMNRLISLIDGQIAGDHDPRVEAEMAAIMNIKQKRETGEIPQLGV
ncbi:MAG: ABC transporter ATP-binding protein [Chloroflexi bacterium]|nr:ABC transporter ATP-binding protein [Chloroflexota bacterium]